METLKNTLVTLLDHAKTLGLQVEDSKNSKEFLDHGEFGLCFDTVITQLYEYDIEIDNEFYELVARIGNKMNLPVENYSFIKKLIKE